MRNSQQYSAVKENMKIFKREKKKNTKEKNRVHTSVSPPLQINEHTFYFPKVQREQTEGGDVLRENVELGRTTKSPTGLSKQNKINYAKKVAVPSTGTETVTKITIPKLNESFEVLKGGKIRSEIAKTYIAATS